MLFMGIFLLLFRHFPQTAGLAEGIVTHSQFFCAQLCFLPGSVAAILTVFSHPFFLALTKLSKAPRLKLMLMSHLTKQRCCISVPIRESCLLLTAVT